MMRSLMKSWLAVAMPAVIVFSGVPSLALEGWVLRNNTGSYEVGDVVLVDLATGNATTVVAGGGSFGYCFSPDGSRIAYWRNGKIYTVNLDGSDVKEICSTYKSGYAQQYLSWTLDDHVYWSEDTPYIYRVNVATGVKETVHTSSNGVIQLAKVSLDGKHAGCTRNEGTWKAWALDLETHEEREIGNGCQATASPDGTRLTHNIPGHQTANIHLFSDLSVFKVINKPKDRGEFDMHEYSHSSNDYIVYTADLEYAYVHDILTDTPYFAGQGAPFDFRLKTTPPILGLSPERLTFNVVAGATNPDDQTVQIKNLGSGTIDAVQIGESADWLSVTVSGAGNGQALANVVDIATLQPDTYATVVSVASSNASNSPKTYSVELIVSPEQGPGTGVLREVWNGVPGTTIADLTSNAAYPDQPSASEVLQSLEGPSQAGENYGSRFRGYVIPPLSGSYVFWIASDDQSRLLLSSSIKPADAIEIASVPDQTAARAWETDPVHQKSAPQTLTAGQKYYVEALHKEGTGNDHLAVRWQLPNGTIEEPLPGHRLDPFVTSAINTPPVVEAGLELALELGIPCWLDGTVTDDGRPNGTLTFQWTEQSGPGEVTFDNAAAEDTEAKMDQTGVYVLRLTASDGALEAYDEVKITIVEVLKPTITILSPQGGEVWKVGETYNVRWTTTNLEDVTIRYFTDGGKTMAGLIDDTVYKTDPEWGNLAWKVPDTPSKQCLIQISGYLNEVPTRSGLFEIRGTEPLTIQGSCGCASPLDSPTGDAPSGALAVILFAIAGRSWRRAASRSRQR